MAQNTNGLMTVAGHSPVCGEDVFIAPGAYVIGRVRVGACSSVWFNTVVRADVNTVDIGARVNVQDLSVIHVSADFPTKIGDEVTIGHRAIVHGCTIGDRALIGMGAVVMDGAVVGDEAIVGAGALVSPGMVVPPRTLVLGTPARVKRQLTDEEVASLAVSAAKYVKAAAAYMASSES